MAAIPQTIDDLAPADYNPRRISAEAASGLSASLSKFGDIAGIVYNSRTGRLVCGHQRVAELRKLGAQLFRADGGVELRVGKTGERFAVRVVDWDEGTEKAANVTANNSAIAGEWTDALAGLVGEVAAYLGEYDANSMRILELMPSLPESPDPDDDTEVDENGIGLTSECPKCGFRW